MGNSEAIAATRTFLKQYCYGSWEKKVIEAGVVLFRKDDNLKGLIEGMLEGKLVYGRPVYEDRDDEVEEGAVLAGKVRDAWLALSRGEGFDLASALRCCREFPDYIAEESMALVAYAGMLDDVAAYLRRKRFYGTRIRPFIQEKRTPPFIFTVKEGDEFHLFDDGVLLETFLRDDPRYLAFAKRWEAAFMAYEKAFLAKHDKTIARISGPMEYAIREGREQLQKRIEEEAITRGRFKKAAGNVLNRLVEGGAE